MRLTMNFSSSEYMCRSVMEFCWTSWPSWQIHPLANLNADVSFRCILINPWASSSNLASGFSDSNCRITIFLKVTWPLDIYDVLLKFFCSAIKQYKINYTTNLLKNQIYDIIWLLAQYLELFYKCWWFIWSPDKYWFHQLDPRRNVIKMSRKSEYEMLREERDRTQEAFRISSDEPNTCEELQQRLNTIDRQMQDYNSKNNSNPWDW